MPTRCSPVSTTRSARDHGHRGWLCGLDPVAAMLDIARRRDDIEWAGTLGGVRGRDRPVRLRDAQPQRPGVGALVGTETTETTGDPAWPRPSVSQGRLRFLDRDTLGDLLAEADFTIEHQYGDGTADRSPLPARS